MAQAEGNLRFFCLWPDFPFRLIPMAHEIKRVATPLAATLTLQSLASMAAVTVPVFAPIAAAEVDISSTYVGVYVALVYLGSMISGLWSGNLIIRYGAIRISQIALGCCGAALALTALGSMPALVASALILGFGYGPMTPASSHILSNNAPPPLMSFVFSLKQTGVPLGGAMAGAIVPSLVLQWGWRHAAVIVGSFCLLVAFLVQASRKKLDADRRPDRKFTFKAFFRPLQMVWSHGPFLKLAVTSMIFSGMQLCLITYLVIYLNKHVGTSLIAAGLTLSAAQSVGIAARIGWGVIADRYIQPRFMLGLLGVGMSLGAVLTAAFSPAWPYVAVLAVSVFYGATAIGWNGVYLAEVARLAPAGEAGLITGGTLFFTYLGVVVGPPFFGALAEGLGSFSMAYAATAAFTLTCGIMLVFSFPNKDQSAVASGR